MTPLGCYESADGGIRRGTAKTILFSVNLTIEASQRLKPPG